MKKILFVVFCLFAGLAQAQNVFQMQVQRELDAAYDAVYAALEEQRFWVVFEANIGANLARMAKRLGDDYNRNELEGIRTMVVCNPWYANQVSNADPAMLSLCPLRVTLTHKAGITTALFARPTVMAEGSAAQAVLQEVEDIVIQAIRAGMQPTKLSGKGK